MAQIVPMLITPNLVPLRDFYESLGFVQTGSWSNQGVLSWVELEFLGTSVMLQLSESADSTVLKQDVELYFVCDNVDGMYATWQRRGLNPSSPSTAFYGMRQLFLRDPDGRRVCFESEVKNVS